jgi:hypothetical protein
MTKLITAQADTLVTAHGDHPTTKEKQGSDPY